MDITGVIVPILVGFILGGVGLLVIIVVIRAVATAKRERNLNVILARAVELRRAQYSDLDDINETEAHELWDAARIELGFSTRYSSLLLANSLVPGESVPWQPF